jgi:hypothetical protein
LLDQQAIIGLLLLGQLMVSDQARVASENVVALGSVDPTIGQALSRPDVMGVRGEAFQQCF